jgi:hypothetical protein
MAYAVLLRLDSAGPCPVIVHDDDQLLCSEGARWRFVAETDDHREAIRVAELLQRRCDSGDV